MNALDRLAERVGIEPFYHDIWGNRRDTTDATKRSLIAAMGLPADDDEAVERSLRRVEERVWRRMLPPAVVAGLETAGPVIVPVSAPAGLSDAAVRWTLRGEDGTVHGGEAALGTLDLLGTATVDGQAYERRALPVAAPPVMGYHRLEVEIRPDGIAGALRGETRLILAPERCRLPEEVVPGGRLWGMGLQLYSLRSATDWGMGDFDDLAGFAERAAALGAGVVGLNPLHALFPADPNHFSPYSPSSRRFLDVFYIDVEAVPELEECEETRTLIASPGFQAELTAARGAELVDYAAVARLKLPALERLYATFRRLHLGPTGESPRGGAFRAFQREFGEPLRRHATFEALHERFYGSDPHLWSWRSWPEGFQDCRSAVVADFVRDNETRVEFFEFLQWEADRQLGAAAARGREAGLGLGFYRDLAVAATPGGAAAWADPDTLVQGANVGAPPDSFNMKGQNWGLAPLSPMGLFEAGYEPFIAMVRANMRHAGALRIDHVMALQHLFWIPGDGGDGAYVEYPFQDLVRIIALESQRQGCVVIGEDLGTVPEGFRPAMERAGVLSYRVLYFERTDDGAFLPPADFPERAMVTITTHDLPTFRGYWTGHDMDWRRRLDLYPDAAAAERDAWDRGTDRWRLLQALGAGGLRPDSYPTDDGGQPWSEDLVVAVHRHLGRTPGQIVMVQIEDALGDIEQPNLPGTTDQHPNWRRRLPETLEGMAGHRLLHAVAAAVATGRGER